MGYLPYPKHVYNKAGASIVVTDLQAETLAADRGYLPLPERPPVEPAAPGGPAHLEYPKLLTRGDETIRVADAAAEAGAVADGFAAAGEASASKKGKKGAKA